jgi:hydrophobic/amphiphilic exporter-1 (mainly G- bacteria), HAE1 family
LTKFFLRRPIFAAVCSIVVMLAGLIVIPGLPIAQYPRIAPPVVSVNATFIGADAQSVESSVTVPLEEAINGVEGLRYITSQSTNNGLSTITCTFDLTRDLDRATADVQNAVQSAVGLLPATVQQTGVIVTKNSGSFVLAMALTSDNPDFDQIKLSNYADVQIKDVLKRISGVNDVRVFGERKYAMRIWVDPKRLADNGLAASDVVNAISAQNQVVPAGSIGAPPNAPHQPYQISVNALGRLQTPEQFRQIIVKATPNGGFVRLGDVARIELGAEDYSSFIAFNGQRNAVGLGVLQLPTANALNVAEAVETKMNELSKSFPSGVHYKLAFDTTTFVRAAVHDVIVTLLIAILLVVIVIYLFLQNWRTTLIPAITIPISLIGTFAFMKAFGFTINTITLFGLTLATGLVVDDAIVVIENITRFINDKKMDPYEGAQGAMNEIQSAVVASSLVLLAVFIPVAFFPGTTGLLYKQFALTIAAAISISLFNSLTLTPALAALLLGGPEHKSRGFMGWVDRVITRSREIYHNSLFPTMRLRGLVLVLFAIGLTATALLYRSTPTAFLPAEDQGYFIVTVQAPEGTPLGYESNVAKKVEDVIRRQPEVDAVFDVGGFSFTGAATNRGIMFIKLKDYADRTKASQSLDAVLGRLRGPLFMIPQAQVFAFAPPSIQGVGSFGGFQFELEDKANLGLDVLTRTGYAYMGLGNQNKNLQSVFTTFRNDSPQLDVNLDRNKAQAVGVDVGDLVSTMGIFLGSLFVNDFDYQNRSYKVFVQADTPFRSTVGDLQRIYVRSSQQGVIPISSLIQTKPGKSAPIIYHYNLFRSLEINGQTPPGSSTGQSIAAMEQIATKVNPPGMGYEWSGISLEEIQAGGQSALIFALGILFVFLVLCAQYESFTDPLIVILSVPLAIFGALIALGIRHLPSDAYAQVGFVMLIGLASKSAILIVEFANQLRAQGLDTITAARRAAETRFRPIMMTSLAFILAVVPLVFASGAGSGARHSLGTAVFGGMVISTILNLFITPVIYVFIVTLRERVTGPRGKTPTTGSPPPPAPVGGGEQAAVSL